MNIYKTVEQKMLPTEKIYRKFNSVYEHKYAYRLTDVDFSVIPEIRRRVQVQLAFIVPNDALQVLLWHLDDAENENLPYYARVQHFDLAHSIYWNMTYFGGIVTPTVLQLFKNAGCV